MRFEYKFSQIVEEEIDISDIGNCCIEAIDVQHQQYYLIIRTDLGTTSIFEYGPIISDIKLLPKSVTNTFKRISFSESKIISIIDKFLSKPGLQLAQEVDFNEALDRCINIIEYFRDRENY